MFRLAIFLLLFFIPFQSSNREIKSFTGIEIKKTDLLSRIYAAENESGLPSFDVLKKAISGFEKLKTRTGLLQKDRLSIIDYSMPSSKKRMWIFDSTTGKLLYNCYVAHGKNSGKEVAAAFSNTPESHQSSLGFFVTGNCYQGKHGLSLYLDGQEENFNDRARERSIVIHGAAYVSEKIVAMQGYLGRSFGCPALPENISTEVINTIKEGSALFIYAPDKAYNSRSTLLNNK